MKSLSYALPRRLHARTATLPIMEWEVIVLLLMLVWPDKVPIPAPPGPAGGNVKTWVTNMDSRGVRVTDDALAPDSPLWPPRSVVLADAGYQRVHLDAWIDAGVPSVSAARARPASAFSAGRVAHANASSATASGE